uniref:VP1 n=1 Tax=Sapovirus 2 rodent/Manhattan TaxID=1562073 RepID=A0A097NZ45_9CALI|nr:VP1 [Sapovirus 2 rodent/Manhattan]
MEGVTQQSQAGPTPVAPQDTIGPTDGLLLPTRVEVPNAAAQRMEMAVATGAVDSNVPASVRTCFATVSTVAWNNRQAAGTFLGSISLSPRVNPYTAHLSAMWAGWGGSMELRVTISGSGIFAGRVCTSVLPPGINPAMVKDPGVFPHAYIDARTTEPVLISVPDIRAVDYHRTDNDELTASVGLWVAQPLINPFSLNAISNCWLTIESRPGPDFDFCLLKAPQQEMDNGISPNVLLPTRLGRSRGNRLGGVVDAMVVVASASQVNHHFNAQSQTFGWSTLPLGPVAAEATAYPNMTPSHVLLGAAGAGPLFPNIVNHWPDTPMNSRWSSNNNIPTSSGGGDHPGVAGPCIIFDDNGDVDETKAVNMIFVTATPNFTNTVDTFDAASTFVYSPWSTSVLPTTGQNVFINPSWINGDQNHAPRERCVPMRDTNFHFAGNGANNICLWRERDFIAWPGRADVYSSQLEFTAQIFQDNVVNIPHNQMAVYNVETGGIVFQVGILENGYMVTSAPIGTVQELDPETQFRFVGLFSTGTTLQGPHGNQGRAARFQ